MSPTVEPQDLRAERLRVMGDDLGGIHHSLWRHVVELHAELQEFRKLYGSPEAVAVLRDTAVQVFGTIRKVLWEHVLLYVARLTDDAETCGHPNLTLMRLPEHITDPALRARIATLLQEAEPKWEPVRVLRNKWLAHLDLYVGTDDPRAAPLPEMNHEALEAALLSMRDILSTVEAFYFGPADRRYYPCRLIGDADVLLFWLRQGLEADRARRAV